MTKIVENYMISLQATSDKRTAVTEKGEVLQRY